MTKIKKRSQEQEEFSSKKIERSIRNAGADEETARKISQGIDHRDWLITTEIRKRVIEKLMLHDAKLGKSYETYQKPARAGK